MNKITVTFNDSAISFNPKPTGALAKALEPLKSMPKKSDPLDDRRIDFVLLTLLEEGWTCVEQPTDPGAADGGSWVFTRG